MSSDIVMLNVALDGRIANLDESRFRTVYDLAAKAQSASIDGADKLMELLRPQLRLVRPDRPKTWQRLVCMPLEAMLSNETESKEGTIPRAILMPLLREVARRCEVPGLTAIVNDAYHELSELRTGNALETFFVRIHPIVSQIFLNAQGDRGARATIFGAAAALIGHGKTIAQSVESGPWLSVIQMLQLPQPVQVLAPSDIEILVRVFASLKDKPSAITCFVLDGFVRRFARPESLAPLLSGTTFKLSPGMRQAALQGIAETVNSDLQRFAEDFAEDEVDAAEAITAARLVGSKLQSTEAYRHRPRGFEKNIEAVRSKIAQAITRTLLEPVDEKLKTAARADDLKTQVRMLSEARAVAGYIGIEPEIARRIAAVCDFALADARIAADALRVASTLEAKSGERSRCVSALRVIERLGGSNEAEGHYRKLGVNLI